MLNGNINKFAVRIGCIDGRTHEAVIDFVKKKFKVNHVDMVTHPGAIKILNNFWSFFARRRLKKSVFVSRTKHESEILIISAHYECAGNPVSPNVQQEQLKKGFELVQKWGFKTVVAIWVNHNWQVEVICQSGVNSRGNRKGKLVEA